MSPEITNLIVWMEKETKKVPFGEVYIKVKLHNGIPTLIEKSSTQKIQLVEQPRGNEK